MRKLIEGILVDVLSGSFGLESAKDLYAVHAIKKIYIKLKFNNK